MCTYIFCETISSQFHDIFPEIQVKSTAITLSLVQKTAFFPNKHFILYLCKPVHVGWCQPTISWTISDEMHWDWSTGPVTMPQCTGRACTGSSSRCHPCLDIHPVRIQPLPGIPQLRTLTQFPIEAHSLKSLLMVGTDLNNLPGSKLTIGREKAILSASEMHRHLLFTPRPENLTCGFTTTAGHAAKETGLPLTSLVSNTSKDLLWLAKVWTPCEKS